MMDTITGLTQHILQLGHYFQSCEAQISASITDYEGCMDMMQRLQGASQAMSWALTDVPWDDHADGEAVVRLQEALVLLVGHHHIAARVHGSPERQRGPIRTISPLQTPATHFSSKGVTLLETSMKDQRNKIRDQPILPQCSLENCSAYSAAPSGGWAPHGFTQQSGLSVGDACRRFWLQRSAAPAAAPWRRP